jgi:hypothetical protein
MTTQPNDMMTLIPNCDGAKRYCPTERAEMRIYLTWLESKNACQDGKEWFAKTFPDGCIYAVLRAALALDNKQDWENWLCSTEGGDTVTGGENCLIRIFEWDAKQSRYRSVFGIVGENGIEPNTPYIAKEGKLVKKP